MANTLQCKFVKAHNHSLEVILNANKLQGKFVRHTIIAWTLYYMANTLQCKFVKAHNHSLYVVLHGKHTKR